MGRVVGASVDGRRVDRFGLYIEAVERGNVIAAPWPQAGLFRAESGVRVPVASERDGLLVLGWKGGKGGQ